MRSPAVAFEGVVIGTSDAVDIIAKQKREALEFYRTDPVAAVSQGVVDEDGVPLDSRKDWGEGRPNPRFGHPLPAHNYLRNVWGVAKKSNSDGSLEKFTMLMSGDNAQQSIPTFKPVRFMAIDKGDKLNASSFTQFAVDKSVAVPCNEDILAKVIAILKIGDLESYHNENREDFNRIVAVEGDVSMLNMEPTSVGSRIMVLEDMEASLEDLDSKSLTCWVPERIDIDFAERSKIIVVGRTSQGFRKDEAGNKTDELGDITLNVFGVYAPEEFKVKVPEKIEEIADLE